MIYLFISNLILIALVIYLVIQFSKERKDLLNRIMSKDYTQYQMFQEKTPEELPSFGDFTDEEEAKIEQNRLSKGE